MSSKIGWSLVLITGFLLMMITFSNPNPSQKIPEQKQVPVVVMETELKTEKIELVSSLDGASIETTTVPTVSIVQEEDTPSDRMENVIQSSSGVLSYSEREYNAMKTRERREAKRQHQKVYKQLRKEWRKELRAALREARESSDYTYYEELKSNPPDKNDLTLDW